MPLEYFDVREFKVLGNEVYHSGPNSFSVSGHSYGFLSDSILLTHTSPCWLWKSNLDSPSGSGLCCFLPELASLKHFNKGVNYKRRFTSSQCFPSPYVCIKHLDNYKLCTVQGFISLSLPNGITSFLQSLDLRCILVWEAYDVCITLPF